MPAVSDDVCTLCGQALPCTCGLRYDQAIPGADTRARELARPFEAFTRRLAHVNRHIVAHHAEIDLGRRLAAQRPRA